MIRKEKPLRDIAKGLEFGNGGSEYKPGKPKPIVKPGKPKPIVKPGKPKPIVKPGKPGKPKIPSRTKDLPFQIMSKRMNNPNGFYYN